MHFSFSSLAALAVLALRATAQTATTCNSGYTYNVVANDQLGAIANNYAVSVQQIVYLNPEITNINVIAIGQRIKIPTPGCIVNVTPTTGCSSTFEYPIRRDDGLWAIGTKYGLSVPQIQAVNPLITNVNLIFVGQIINIPNINCAVRRRSNDCDSGKVYTVVSGDGLSAIAGKFNVTLAQIVFLNPEITNVDQISIGQQIKIPKATCVVTTPAPAPGCKLNGTYTVVSGDTLGAIAGKYQVTLYQLVFVNPQITNIDQISIGQQINIPETGCVVTPSPPSGCNSTITYTIVSGDTLGAIATKYNVTLDQIVFVNPEITDVNKISVGQQIKIPGSGCVVTPTPTPGCNSTITYSVVSGDTLGAIATKYNVTLDQIVAVNPEITDVNKIFVGQQITIPSPGCAPSCDITSTYSVKTGDTLGAIATRYNVTLDQIVFVNPEITNVDAIFPDQQIKIPNTSCVAPVRTPKPVVTATCVKSGCDKYIVLKGETLTIIANENLGITLDSLVKANPQITNIDLIFPGQALHVPVCAGHKRPKKAHSEFDQITGRAFRA